MIDYLYFDFETKSGVDLTKCGIYPYVYDDLADIVCLSYKFGSEDTKLWLPGMPAPDFTQYDAIAYLAFNAYFDWKVWNVLGPKYDFKSMPITKIIDLQALCARYGYPKKLDTVAKVLKLKDQKETQGKLLIKKICCPPFKHTEQDLLDFYDYCIQDTQMLRELHKALPSNTLSKFEQNVWQMTVDINETGLPVDIPAARQIKKVAQVYQEAQAERLPDLTKGQITKITQTQRIKKWCREQNYSIENTQEATVKKAIEDPNIPANVKELLTMRRDLGKSSLAKFSKAIDMQYNNRLYDTLNYHGTLTGRFSGKGFQIHSLPRNSFNDEQIKEALAKFYDLSILYADPIATARELIRPIIRAEEGHSIVAADYTAIENRLLSWYADDTRSLDLFKQGADQYIDMAVTLVAKEYAEITGNERRQGKIIALGCGYGMGPTAFQKTAASLGWEMSISMATDVVSKYRYKYKKIVDMWYAYARAAMTVVNKPGTYEYIHKCTFKCQKDRNETNWLCITLPTGHILYYNNPIIEQKQYGPVITFEGIDPYTHKWARLTLLHTKLINNIVQATARDILVHSKLELKKAGYTIVASLHDEIILHQSNATEQTLNDTIKIMTKPPKSLGTVSLAAAGYVGPYYRKF